MLFNSVFTIFWDFNIQCRVCYTACSVNRRETVSLFKFPIKSLMIPFELNWPVSLITIYIYIICYHCTNNYSLQPRHVEPWSRWATAAEDHIGCHSCQLRTGNGAYNSHRLTKIGQWKIGKTLLGLMSLDFCCNIRMVGSEFGIKNMKAWIHLVLSQRFRLLVVV